MAYSNKQSAVGIVGPVIPVSNSTDVAVTYSAESGMSLYINGTLNNSLASFSFVSGAVDELRVYSRELSADQVAFLANQSLPIVEGDGMWA